MFAVPPSTNFPSALPVTQACVLFYRESTAVPNALPSTPSSNMIVISCDWSAEEPVKTHLTSGHCESEFELEQVFMWNVSPAADDRLTVKMAWASRLGCHGFQQTRVESEMCACVHSARQQQNRKEKWVTTDSVEHYLLDFSAIVLPAEHNGRYYKCLKLPS